MAGNALKVPQYVIARSPKGLLLSMLKNNLKDGMEYHYYDISFDGKNWVAWFKKQLSYQEAQSING